MLGQAGRVAYGKFSAGHVDGPPRDGVVGRWDWTHQICLAQH